VTPRGVNATFSHVELNSNLTLIGERVAAKSRSASMPYSTPPVTRRFEQGKLNRFLAALPPPTFLCWHRICEQSRSSAA